MRSIGLEITSGHGRDAFDDGLRLLSDCRGSLGVRRSAAIVFDMNFDFIAHRIEKRSAFDDQSQQRNKFADRHGPAIKPA